jgi:hypothetical protein
MTAGEQWKRYLLHFSILKRIEKTVARIARHARKDTPVTGKVK